MPGATGSKPLGVVFVHRWCRIECRGTETDDRGFGAEEVEPHIEGLDDSSILKISLGYFYRHRNGIILQVSETHPPHVTPPTYYPPYVFTIM